MKRDTFAPLLAALPVLLLILLLSSCVSTSTMKAPGLDQVVHRWITALHEEDIDLMMTTYWPEAELSLPKAEGGEKLLRGSEEIRQLQQMSFDMPMSNRDLRIVEVDRHVESTSATVHLRVGGDDWTNLNTLKFQRRGDEWKIIYQTIEPLPGQ